MELQVGDSISGVIEKLIFSGRGLFRHHGAVILVEGVGSKEEVQVLITQKKKNYYIGQLKGVITPSPSRRAPYCPHFGDCGGCALQHIAYKDQITAKKAWITESFMKIAKIEIEDTFPLYPSPEEFAYRRKISLHFAYHEKEKRYALGFIGKDNKELIQISFCPLFQEENTLFREIHQVLSLIEPKRPLQGTITVIKGEDGKFHLSFHFEEKVMLPKRKIEELVISFPLWGKVLFSDKKETYVCKDEPLFFMSEGLKIFYDLDVFLQNHKEQSLKLYQSIIAQVEKVEPKGPILDLYCGIGTLSLLLKQKGFSVLGVESNKKAITLAKLSLQENKMKEGISFLDKKVEDVLDTIEAEKSEFWVLNPPRIGLHPMIIERILKAAPKYLVYVSCMPPTLARDFALLKERYIIDEIDAFDMFPQTTHVETKILLKRKGSSEK